MAEAKAWVMIPKSYDKGAKVVIDMRPLVLCKDCVKRNFDDCPVFGWKGETEDDWFCADGERKESK